MLQLKKVETKKDLDQFIEFPWSIYTNDPYWVPPLRMAVKDLLDVQKNPFFKHAQIVNFMAFDGDKMVGRISGVVDNENNRVRNEKAVFFGFFECINDQKVANALFDEVAKWGREKGMTVMRGPMNPSTNHECGLLVEGFQDPPSVMMTYNPPYYAELIDKAGFAKAKDLLAYIVDSQTSKFSEKLLAQSERLRQRAEITFREADLSKWDEEVSMILDIYNDAWEDNWGFVPMNDEEFRHMAKDMKMIVDPKLLLVAELKGKPIGFGLALPDVNQAQIKVKDGKLLPFGIFKLLWNLKGPGKAKSMNRCRIITLGIKKQYQSLGVGPLLYTEYLKRAPSIGYPQGEASWILEDNIPMNKALEHMGARKTKVYRLYDRNLSQ